MGVVLKFLEGDRRVRETVYGRPYLIKAEVQQPNATYGIRVKNCFAFNKRNGSLNLIDDRGCSVDTNIITNFVASEDGRSAIAMLNSMFKFPDISEMQFQCDIEQCNGRCADISDASCRSVARYVNDDVKRPQGQAQNGLMLAATTVYVIDPQNAPRKINFNLILANDYELIE